MKKLQAIKIALLIIILAEEIKRARNQTELITKNEEETTITREAIDLYLKTRHLSRHHF
ncbi:hypothetical protein [Macrococcus brunensis]|uniref:hypothetical protein n=1 Tax=Macrococcus brunensis TaxID=198483 RepID=UPI00140C0FD7|nr:hypothetical protein [Macrococcus brunensis]